MFCLAAGSRPLQHRFNHDELREFFADSETRIANLTNEIVLACDEFDDLILAKTDFAEAILNFRCGA
jgi:hypothetical protein